MSRDIKGAIDTPGEYSGFIIGLILIGGLFGGLYVFNTPNLEDKVYAFTHEEADLSGEKIVFEEKYHGVSPKAEINKIYQSVEDEYGWCLRVQGTQVEKFSSFTKLNETTPEHIRFSCSTDKYNAIMHTHPSKYGIARLSDQDRQSLLGNKWIEASCVVAGVIPMETSENIEGINCYKDMNGTVQKLDVKFK